MNLERLVATMKHDLAYDYRYRFSDPTSLAMGNVTLKKSPELDGTYLGLYHPTEDYIQVVDGRFHLQPLVNASDYVYDYYETFWHEMIHWTGHTTRLGRLSEVGSREWWFNTQYKEEAIAVVGAYVLLSLFNYPLLNLPFNQQKLDYYLQCPIRDSWQKDTMQACKYILDWLSKLSTAQAGTYGGDMVSLEGLSAP